MCKTTAIIQKVHQQKTYSNRHRIQLLTTAQTAFQTNSQKLSLAELAFPDFH